jgi:hypothetical protein
MSESSEAQRGGSSPDDLEGGADAPVSTTASSLFDLRSVIALLFGVYGIVLLIMGLVSGNDPANLAKTGGSNLNLETGIAMLVIGALFVVWTLTRPLKLPSPDEVDGTKDAGPGGH